MTRSRLAGHAGFTVIEVMVAAMLLTIGILGLMASMDVFRSQTSSTVVREAATHEAQKELEYLRSLGYKRLILSASPGTSADPRDPRSGVSGVTYRPASNVAYAPLVVNAAAEEPVAPSRAWTSGRASGTVYRFITQEPAGTTGCGQICPKRVTVAVTYMGAGVLRSVVMTSMVADPQAGTADDITPEPTKPATCPCWTTFYLYDTAGINISRQTPTTDHILHKRDDFPDLMDVDPPPNPFENSLTPPFEPTRYRYGTDLEASDGLGQTYPAGAIVKQSRGCNEDGDPKKSARWTTKPVTQNTVLHGNATASIFTRLIGNLTGNATICFTFYDQHIRGSDGKIDNKVKLNQLIVGFAQDWPSGTPDLVTTSLVRYRNTGANYTLAPGRSLGVEITIDDSSVGHAALFYDHPELASSIQVDSTPAF